MNSKRSGTEVIKLFSCSTQLSKKTILLINLKMPTIVGILTFISMKNTTFEGLKARNSIFPVIFISPFFDLRIICEVLNFNIY